MAIRKSHGCVFQWRRARVASLLMAGPVLFGSAALAQPPNASLPPGTTDHSVDQAVAEHPASVPPTVTLVGAEDGRRGMFSWFRGRGSDSGVDRPSLLDRMRGRDAEPAPAASPQPRQGLMGRWFGEGETGRGGEGENKIGEAGEAGDYASERSGTMTPPPAPSPSTPATSAPSPNRTARLENDINYRDSGLLLKRANPETEMAEQPGLVPLPDDHAFETDSPPATKSFPPPPPPSMDPAPEPAHVPAVPEPIDEGPSLNMVPAPSPIEEPVAEITASPGNPAEDARYVALTRKLAERSGLVGMQGFCPVALRERRELVDARPEFLCVHRGRTYQVSTAGAKARFDANPERYAPAARGFDVVLISQGEGEIDGTLTNSVWLDNRLYLFATPETASEFSENPEQYVVEE